MSKGFSQNLFFRICKNCGNSNCNECSSFIIIVCRLTDHMMHKIQGAPYLSGMHTCTQIAQSTYRHMLICHEIPSVFVSLSASTEKKNFCNIGLRTHRSYFSQQYFFPMDFFALCIYTEIVYIFLLF